MSDSIMFKNTYLKNIKDYFKDKKTINTSSAFEKAAYDLYKMVLENKPESVINEQIKYVNTLPVSYFEMRAMFG